MSYWRTVGRATAVCFVLGVVWQGFLLVRALRQTQEGRAYGVAMLGVGLAEFIVTVLIAGIVVGSAWYLMRK